jgi:hypothetical protein
MIIRVEPNDGETWIQTDTSRVRMKGRTGEPSASQGMLEAAPN